MEHAHTIALRLAASTLLVGLAATLAGCATPVASTLGEQARAGGPARVSTEAHLDMARDSAELYVSGLVANARADAASDPHRQQLQAQVERYLADLLERAQAAREAAEDGDDPSPTPPR
ncbi:MULTISPECIES: hypothetical protein [unclassified Agromyces]|uniref:hypothetical protein n=1 Tax=unclassified Agromyces TaxID=2639701 RepID=UPI0030155D7F